MTLRRWFGICGLAMVLGWALALSQSFAADTIGGHGKRQKVIDFDDEVVEGVNKQPLDSLNEIAERDKHKHKPHLYRKRAGFRTETAETLRLLKYE